MRTRLPHIALSELLTEFDSVLIKVAHSLRSPLSVLSGVIEDLESGCALTTEDITDAKLSLQRIIQELTDLRLSPLPDTTPIVASSLDSIAERIRACTGLNCHAKGSYSMQRPADLRVLIAMISLLSQSEKNFAADGEKNSEFEIEEKNGMLRVSRAGTISAPSTSSPVLDESTPPPRTSPTLLALNTLLRTIYGSALQAQLPSNCESTLLFEVPFCLLDSTETTDTALPKDTAPPKNTALPTSSTPK